MSRRDGNQESMMMGNEFFGLTKRPFIAEPVPEAYCPFGSAEQARVRVTRCVERQEGAALVAGRSGTGKTLLCRLLMNQFRDSMETALLNGKNLNHPKAFFKTLLTVFNIPYEDQDLTAMRTALVQSLETSRRFRSGLLLLIDDAQATAIRVFEEIRQLLDRTGTRRQGFHVVLFGNSSLEEKLAFPQLDSFSQRITTRCFLETMNRDETTAFLKLELTQAGDSKGLFSKDVCREIHRFADGQPRLVNQLADHVLVLAQETHSRLELELAEKPEATLEAEKFDAWESDPFAIDSDVIDSDGIDSDVTKSNLDESGVNNSNVTGVSSESETIAKIKSNTSKINILITPALVRKAWSSLQQLPEEGLNGGETASDEFSGSAFGSESGSTSTGNSSCFNAGNSTRPAQTNAEKFGSLDDDLDDEHTIDYGAESSEDSTLVWSYDEAQAVRNAVDEANAIPEEWNESALENAHHAEETEKGTEEETEEETENQYKNEKPHVAEQPKVSAAMSEIASAPTEGGASSQSLENTTDPDLWDIYHETANIQFPPRKESAWTPPSYSSSKPETSTFEQSDSFISQPSSASFRGSNGSNGESIGRSNGESIGKYNATQSGSSFGFSSSRPSFSGSLNSGTGSSVSVGNSAFCEPSEPTPTHALSVDEMIFDAIMSETVHSMTLLQKILRALREESLHGNTVGRPSDYWTAIQDLARDSIRKIALERMAQPSPRPQNFAQTFNSFQSTNPTQNSSAIQSINPAQNPTSFASGANYTWNQAFNSGMNGAQGTNANGACAQSQETSIEHDFYRPESLIEEGSLKRTIREPNTFSPHFSERQNPLAPASGSAFPNSPNPAVPSAHSAFSQQSLHSTDSVTKEESSTKSNQALTSSEELQKISTLRSILQDPSVRNAIDSEIQARISQMITRLETINQYT